MGDQVETEEQAAARKEWTDNFSAEQLELAKDEPWYAEHLHRELEAKREAAAETPNPIKDYQQTKRAALKLVAGLVAAPLLITGLWMGGKAAADAYGQRPQPQARAEQPQRPIGPGAKVETDPYRPSTQEEFMALLKGDSRNAVFLQRPLLPLSGKGKDVPIIITNPDGGFEIFEEKDRVKYTRDGWIEWMTLTRPSDGLTRTFVCNVNDKALIRDTTGKYYPRSEFPNLGSFDPKEHRYSSLRNC